jgi:type II secretion system protein D
MRILNAGVWGKPIILAALAVLVGAGAYLTAADPEKKEASTEKRIAFAMDGKPWEAVFKWLTNETGKDVVYINKPTGTFSFIGRDKKTYTLPEVIDIINGGLLSASQTQKYYLINGERVFTVVPADEKIDPILLPQLTPRQLADHGDTEIVRLILPLTSLNAEDMAPRLGAIMGPFHEAVAMPGNRLVLQDTVGNIRRVMDTLKDIEESEKTQSDSYSHVCKYIRARDGEKILRTLMGEPQVVQAPTAAAPAAAPPMFTPPAAPPMFTPPGQPGAPPMFTPPMATPTTPAPTTFPSVPSRPAPVRLSRQFYIASDDAKNLILVKGPPEIIATAKDLIENRLDKPADGQKPVLVGPPAFKTIAVPDGNAESLAKILESPFPASSTLRITAAGSNSLRVYACPEDLDAIEKLVEQIGKGVKGVLIDVGSLEPAKAATTLLAMFGDAKSGGPYIEAVPDQNGVLIRGSTEQVSEIRAIIDVMNGRGPAASGTGAAPAFDAGHTRVITLDSGSGSAVAAELQRLLSQMRANPVHVVTPGGVRETPSDKKPQQPSPDMPKAPDARKRAAGDIVPVAQRPGDGGAFVDPQDKKDAKPEDKPGKADMPVIIAASGNRLIISSQDPDALSMASQLVRLMTQTTAGEGDFEVIPLKNASAAEAAKLLDAAFNEVKAPAQQQGFGGGFFGRFGGQGAQPPANPTPNRIRVVADSTTNSLLVRAKPVDMLTIRWLLDKAIDNKDKGVTAGPKNRIIGPLKYAKATEVADLLKNVYRDQINQNPTLSDIDKGGFGLVIAASQNRNTDASGASRPVTLTVAVDDQSNSLIVNSTEPLYEEIKKLVETVDAAAKDNHRTIRLVQIKKGVDPLLIQEAVDAIQGKTTSLQPVTPGATNNNNNDNGGGGGGGPRRRRNNRAPDRTGRGPDFFDGRVMDDPQSSGFYDPQHDAAIKPVSYEEEQQPESAPAPAPMDLGDFPAPRTTVTVQPLPGLGIYVVTSNNPADAELIARFLEALGNAAPSSNLEIMLLPLQKADATGVANTLSQLYQRVIVGPSGNSQGTTVKKTTQAQGGATTTEEQLASVVLIPVPRLNALLIAAPESRIKEVVLEVKKLDVDNGAAGQATPFALKKASASRVSTLLTNFYNQRYSEGGEDQSKHQIRITFDVSTNTVFVQAAPADMAEIRDLIQYLDTDVSHAVNSLRIKRLKHAVAADVAALLQRAIGYGVAPQTQPAGTGGGAGAGATPGQATPPGGGAPGAPGGGFQGGQGGPGGRQGAGAGAGAPGAGAGAPGAAAGATTGATTGTGATSAPGATTKSTSLRFISPVGNRIIESGLLEDIFILADDNTNSLLLSAPEKTMELLDTLIDALDVPPAAQYVVKVITLKKNDAAALATMLQQLFLGTGGTGSGRTVTGGTTAGGTTGGGGAGAGAGAAGGGGAGAGAGGAGAGAAGAGGASGAGRPLQLSLSGPSEGPQLTDLRITIDERTNSIIAAGSASDLDIILALVAKLEATSEGGEVLNRRNEVYHLKNATATDVAQALNVFLSNSINLLRTNGQLTPFQDLEHEVVVVPEAVTNKLLISATPRFYDDVFRLIQELDAESPQVMIQVLIAEVDLTGSEEFGIEFGLQSPVLFNRSITPAAGLIGPNGSINFANAAGGLVPPGVTINSSINPAAQPGFNFNNPSLPLGNNPAVSPAQVGFQGLGSLGVGRVSPASGIGGFVFSAASDSFSLLIRALKTQGRIDILSRPQIMTLDNQLANIHVGQSIPYVSGTNVLATGIISNSVLYKDVGVQLQVTPRISPDGRVLMRVIPEVSSVAPTSINLGNGTLATAFNVQNITTTVSAQDGETVALGGLIQRRDEKNENKIPWFGDLPFVGSAFRYRTQTKAKTELLVILTPHIVRSRADADRVLAEESRRMDYILEDVVRTHGLSGMEPVLHPNAYAPLPGKGGVDGCLPSPLMQPSMPVDRLLGTPPLPYGPESLPPPRVAPPGGAPETLPPPRGGPPGGAQGPVVPVPDAVQSVSAPSVGAAPPAPPLPIVAENAVAPPEPKKEPERWRLFRKQ